uniref:Ovule protein n=1 Tax=Loa loa TaxID=7209 RepID=A0A1I7V854_LOALO
CYETNISEQKMKISAFLENYLSIIPLETVMKRGRSLETENTAARCPCISARYIHAFTCTVAHTGDTCTNMHRRIQNAPK